ncbi:type 1 fimbrial protein [Enterobacter sp. Acro-832]|uniref:fimbrial protein n=1 Tax=Enterobacter sp. Acro-832 TaxID=2608348 RepID=UPI0014238C26|nr:fimbrial protein [Enterobacter sp. Acro-832]NIG46418.1 type 1 fimbrial protein [Enterobacter sp. Acro-832]
MGRRQRIRRGGLTEAVLLCGALASLPAQADTDVEFSGTLVADPCVVDTDSQEQEIDFGNIASKTFINHESTAPKDFRIRLLECDLTLGTQVSVTFLGDESLTQPGAFAVTGDAKGIAVRIEDAEGRTVAPNRAHGAGDLLQGETVLAYRARVTAKNVSEVTEGEFMAVATFALDWE